MRLEMMVMSEAQSSWNVAAEPLILIFAYFLRSTRLTEIPLDLTMSLGFGLSNCFDGFFQMRSSNPPCGPSACNLDRHVTGKGTPWRNVEPQGTIKVSSTYSPSGWKHDDEGLRWHWTCLHNLSCVPCLRLMMRLHSSTRFSSFKEAPSAGGAFSSASSFPMGLVKMSELRGDWRPHTNLSVLNWSLDIPVQSNSMIFSLPTWLGMPFWRAVICCCWFVIRSVSRRIACFRSSLISWRLSGFSGGRGTIAWTGTKHDINRAFLLPGMAGSFRSSPKSVTL